MDFDSTGYEDHIELDVYVQLGKFWNKSDCEKVLLLRNHKRFFGNFKMSNLLKSAFPMNLVDTKKIILVKLICLSPSKL